MSNPFQKEKNREKGYCLKQLEGDLYINYKDGENIRTIHIQNYQGEPYRPKNQDEEKKIQEQIAKGANIVKYDTIGTVEIHEMCDKALFNVKNKKQLLEAVAK